MAMKNGLYQRPCRGQMLWWIQYRCNGKTIRENTRCLDKKSAQLILAQRKLAASKGQVIPDERKVTFEELVQLIEHDYVAQQHRSEPRLKYLKEAFAGSLAYTITTDRVRAFEAARLAAGAARATLNHDLKALRRMFRLAIEVGRLTSMPRIKVPKVNNARTGFFEQDDFNAVLAELPDHLKPPFEFMYLTGWRKMEVLTLTWPQVDFNSGLVRLEPGTTKNDEGREFPFSVYPPLAQLLKEQRDRTKALERAKGVVIPWVFHRQGNRIRDPYAGWRHALKRAAHAKGPDGRPLALVIRPSLIGRIPHDFRRTAVRNLEWAGVPRFVAMKLTGHLTETIYTRYAIGVTDDLRKGVEKLAAFHAKPKTFDKAASG